MNIQWYPGHMARAGREIKEDVSAVDAVVEIVDARIPVSSRNPSLDGILRNKPRVIALNRADLSELSETEKWILKFNSQGIPRLPVTQRAEPVSARFPQLRHFRKNLKYARGAEAARCP